MYIEKGEKLGSLKCSFAKGGVKVFNGLGAPEWAGEESEVRLLEETWKRVDDQEDAEASRRKKVFKIRQHAEEEPMRDDWDDLCDEALLEADADSQHPVVEIPFVTKDRVEIAETIVDDTCAYNLVSKAFLEALGEHESTRSKERAPSLVNGSGEVETSTGNVTLWMKVNGRLKKGEFWIWPGLHKDVVIGRETSQELGGRHDESLKEWNVEPKGDTKFSFKWTGTTGWKTSIPLRLKEDVILPPRSHSKVRVEGSGMESISALRNSVKMISPPGGSFTKEAYKTAWGPCDSPEWVQIANPTTSPIKLKKGERVADISIDEEWKIQNCNLDPTKEEHRKELFSQKSSEVLRELLGRWFPSMFFKKGRGTRFL
jgi:hypothetical protein